MATLTLHQINAEIAALSEELIDSADDETEQTAIMHALDALALQREQKLENIAYVRIQMKADITAIDAEIKRLQARKRATENAAGRLDEYVMSEMKHAGITKYKGKLANITVAKSPVSCEIVDDTAVPDEYREVETTVKFLRSDAIRHYKQTGEILPGMKFYQNEHLRIQ